MIACCTNYPEFRKERFFFCDRDRKKLIEGSGRGCCEWWGAEKHLSGVEVTFIRLVDDLEIIPVMVLFFWMVYFSVDGIREGFTPGAWY